MGAAAVAGALVTGLIAASPAQAAEYGIKTAPSGFGVASSSSSRITFNWSRPISKGVQRVKYTVTIAGNRDMNRDANYQVKTGYGYTRTSTRTTTKDVSPVFGIKQPTLNSYGARIWVNVVTTTLGSKKYKKADPQKATNRYSAGLQPGALSDPAKALKVTATCKGFTARWNTMPERSRGLKVEVAGPTGNQTFVGYEPARSIAISTLSSGTSYRVRAQATSVKQRGEWTDWQSVTTKSCADAVVRVGSYNVQKQGANKVSWTTRAPRAASGISAANLDVVGLQEAPSYSYRQLQILQSELSKRKKTYNRGDSSNGGVHLIYNTATTVPVGSAHYNSGINNSIAVARAFRSSLSRTAPPYVVVSVHSTAGKQSEVADGVRLAEALKTDEGLDPTTPVIFVGDIVLRSTDETRTAVRAELSKTMSDAEYYRPGRALDLYNSRNALKTCPPHVSGIKVDGIFASDTAAVTSWYMPQYGFSKGCFRSGFPSDHNLLTANVWVPAA